MTRQPAPRPAGRSVDVTLAEGPFATWSVTAAADFPAGMLADLQSGDLALIIAVMDAIVTDHNLPNDQGELAASMRDVSPYDGLLAIAAELFQAIGKLPNR